MILLENIVLTVMFSNSKHLFMTHITESELSSLLMAEPLNIKRSYASMLSRGLKKPSLDLAVKIEKTLGIKPSFWVTCDGDTGVASSEADDVTINHGAVDKSNPCPNQDSFGGSARVKNDEFCAGEHDLKRCFHINLPRQAWGGSSLRRK